MAGPTRSKRGAALVESAAADQKGGVESTLKTLSHISPEELQHILDDIDTEVANRVKRMRLEAETQIMSIQNAFHVELLKIPKSVRSMSIREFSEHYGEDIRTVMRSTVEEETSKALAASEKAGVTGTVVKAPRPAKTERATRSRSKTASSSTDAAGSAAGKTAQTPSTRTTRSRAGTRSTAETPSAVRLNPRLPNTPAVRAPRHGESILSINGSPLAISASESASSAMPARATLGPATRAEASSPTVTLEVPLGGTAVDLLKDPAALENMTDEMKAGVQRQLEKLQGGLAAVLQRIQGSSASGDNPDGDNPDGDAPPPAVKGN